MPVESADLEAAGGRYALTLRQIGRLARRARSRPSRPGPDGHTASLVPGIRCWTSPAQTSRSRGSIKGAPDDLDLPVLNRARRIVWLITGREKGEMLAAPV